MTALALVVLALISVGFSSTTIAAGEHSAVGGSPAVRGFDGSKSPFNGRLLQSSIDPAVPGPSTSVSSSSLVNVTSRLAVFFNAHYIYVSVIAREFLGGGAFPSSVVPPSHPPVTPSCSSGTGYFKIICNGTTAGDYCPSSSQYLMNPGGAPRG